MTIKKKEQVGCGKVISEGDNVIYGKDEKYCYKCSRKLKENKNVTSFFPLMTFSFKFSHLLI